MAENPKNESSNPGRSGSPLKLFGFHLTKPMGHLQTTGPTEQRPRIQCQFCDRTFPNSQGLGGHQNAHKRERQLKRISQQRHPPQKKLMPRPQFVVTASAQAFNFPLPLFQPPFLSLSPPVAPHVEPRWRQLRPPIIMDYSSPSTSTRVYLKEASDGKENCFSSCTNTCHEIIHVGSDDSNGSSEMEDVNVDLRL